MSFLSIAFLAALPLVVAPILLHLFDRRRNVEIEWGAMQFLMQASSRKTSARRLKELLLLLLRVLAIAALVFALARPTLPGNWFGTKSRSELILVIDNSMSMMRSASGVALFDQAIQRAIEQLDKTEPGDAIRLLITSPYPIWSTTGTLRIDPGSRRSIESHLRELKPTLGRSDLLAALMTAVQTDLDPTQKRRRVVLISDGQATDWRLSDQVGWQQFRDVLKNLTTPTDLEIVELSSEGSSATNIAINVVTTNRSVVGVNQAFSLIAQIQNHGLKASPPCQAYWTAPGEERQEVQVPGLAPGQSHDLVWNHSITTLGACAIACELDIEDELGLDNRSTCVVEVVDRVPIVVVESAPELAELQRDSFFVQAALGWLDGEALDEPGVYVPTIVSPERIESIDLSTVRAIVVPNLTELSETAIASIQEFVFEGGGLWMGLGPRTDLEVFNQHLFADGNGLAPLPLDRIIEENVSEKRKTTINPFVKEHPATLELTNNQTLDTGDIIVTHRFRFVEPPQGQEASVLLGLSNGEPLAVEKYHGRGRVIVQSIPLRLQWSTLAKSQAFVVMVQDWLSYLSQPRSTRHNLSPGDPISIQFSDSSTREATLRTPSGDTIELSGDRVGDGMVFRSSRTILPGDYYLEMGLSGDAIPFHVQRDPLESNLATLMSREQEVLAEAAGLSGKSQGSQVALSNQKDPLWPVLLLFLIVAMVTELLLCGMISKQRFGADPISETTERWSEASLDQPKFVSAVTTRSQRSHREKVGA